MEKKAYLLEQLKALMAIPSPTGMTGAASDYVMKELQRMGFTPTKQHKGTVLCDLGGEGHGVLISAHLDTLGAIVRSVKSNGCLRYSNIGGFNHGAIENENVLVHTRTGKVYSATVQCTKASRHVWRSTDELDRSDETMEIVLDELTWSKDATLALGVSAGDFISFDPRTTVTDTGFVKSRFLDDKASAAVLLTLAKLIAEGEVKPARHLVIAFTVYEEIGHGASGFGNISGIEDMLAVDMGCVGDDLNGKEINLSICAKDAAGPYDFDFTNELIARSQKLGLNYVVDVFQSYSSDTATALKAGLDARFALCGPCVYASHGYERTHVTALMDTLALVTSVGTDVI